MFHSWKRGGGDDRGKSLSSRDFLEAKYEFALRNPALWTELQWQLFDQHLLLVPGIRAEYDTLLEAYAADPRLTVRYGCQGPNCSEGWGWVLQSETES